jgi:nucleoside-diphosphate-sugar epimerase
LKPLRVLVIGGTRFMGYHLVWRLLAGGHQVTVLNRGRTPDPFGARVQRIQGDRASLKALLAGRRFEAAVDFIAYAADDVAQAVEALPGVAHYVLISTGQVYLVREGCPRPARESDYEGPLMAAPKEAADRAEWDYGMGKRGAEDVLHEAFRSRNFPGTVLRIPVVNGERDNSRRLEGYLWRLLDGNPLLLPSVPAGEPSPLRHVYCHDVVRAIESLLTGEDVMGQAYNVCQQEAPTLLELITLLAELMGARPCLVEASAEQLAAAGLAPRAVSPFSSRWISHLDPARAMAELDFRPTPLRQALASIVASFVAHLPATPPETYTTRAQETALAQAIMDGSA